MADSIRNNPDEESENDPLIDGLPTDARTRLGKMFLELDIDLRNRVSRLIVAGIVAIIASIVTEASFETQCATFSFFINGGPGRAWSDHQRGGGTPGRGAHPGSLRRRRELLQPETIPDGTSGRPRGLSGLSAMSNPCRRWTLAIARRRERVDDSSRGRSDRARARTPLCCLDTDVPSRNIPGRSSSHGEERSSV